MVGSAKTLWVSVPFMVSQRETYWERRSGEDRWENEARPL